MEIRIVARGALAGLVAGVLGFVFARVFAEPLINRAIAYESGRDDVLAKLNRAAGQAVAADGPEVFSRSVQSTVGLATGIIAFATAMGALVAVGYVVLHGRFGVRPMHVVWLVAGFGFLGIYLLPFVKYPANPPGIGHSFTVTARGHLYLAMVVGSLVLLGLAVYGARWLLPRFGLGRSILLAALGFLVCYGVLVGLLPSLGHLAANRAHAGQFGYAPAATETPQPVTNILSTPLRVDGRTIAPGQIVYPGFDADLLWKFRWYSVIDQLLVWLTTAVLLGALVERHLAPRRPLARPREPVEVPA